MASRNKVCKIFFSLLVWLPFPSQLEHKIKIKFWGQWCWLGWQRGCIRHQRSAVGIPTSTKFYLPKVQLKVEKTKVKKEAGNGPSLKNIKIWYLEWLCLSQSKLIIELKLDVLDDVLLKEFQLTHRGTTAAAAWMKQACEKKIWIVEGHCWKKETQTCWFIFAFCLFSFETLTAGKKRYKRKRTEMNLQQHHSEKNEKTA